MSRSPKPLDLDVFVNGLGFLSSSISSLSLIVKYHPKMIWRLKEWKGENTMSGYQWSHYSHANVAKNFQYCLVGVQLGSGIGGVRDPHIIGYGPNGSASDWGAEKFCGNDLNKLERELQVRKESVANLDLKP